MVQSCRIFIIITMGSTPQRFVLIPYSLYKYHVLDSQENKKSAQSQPPSEENSAAHNLKTDILLNSNLAAPSKQLAVASRLYSKPESSSPLTIQQRPPQGIHVSQIKDNILDIQQTYWKQRTRRHSRKWRWDYCRQSRCQRGHWRFFIRFTTTKQIVER